LEAAIQKAGSAPELARDMKVGANTPNAWRSRLRVGGRLSQDKRQLLERYLSELTAELTRAATTMRAARRPTAKASVLTPHEVTATAIIGELLTAIVAKEPARKLELIWKDLGVEMDTVIRQRQPRKP
jgi:transposase-like protein